MILEGEQPRKFGQGVPSGALRQLGFIAAVTGRFRSMSPQPAIQRRKSPSVSTPEDAGFRYNKNQPRLVCGDLAEGRRMLSSAKTTNWVKFRSIWMPFTGSPLASQLVNRETLPHIPMGDGYQKAPISRLGHCTAHRRRATLRCFGRIRLASISRLLASSQLRIRMASRRCAAAG